MINTLRGSSSILGNLSKEAYSIRLRYKNVMNSTLSCKDQQLLNRLKKELKLLEERRHEILNIAIYYKKITLIDNLSIEFLIELSKRPIII